MTIFELMDSGYLIMEVDNWHLKEDAPEHIKKAFKEWENLEKEAKKKGIILY